MSRTARSIMLLGLLLGSVTLTACSDASSATAPSPSFDTCKPEGQGSGTRC